MEQRINLTANYVITCTRKLFSFGLCVCGRVCVYVCVAAKCLNVPLEKSNEKVTEMNDPDNPVQTMTSQVIKCFHLLFL